MKTQRAPRKVTMKARFKEVSDSVRQQVLAMLAKDMMAHWKNGDWDDQEGAIAYSYGALDGLMAALATCMTIHICKRTQGLASTDPTVQKTFQRIHAGLRDFFRATMDIETGDEGGADTAARVPAQERKGHA